MRLLKKLYKEYIYGIMGTLVFHILVVLVFLLAQVRVKKNITETEIVIEMPVEIVEIQKPEEEAAGQQQELTNTPSDASLNATAGRMTNRPSNRLATSDKFFDENYSNEIRSAQNLVKEVDKQLSKKPVSLDDIKMPVETTEGLDPEEVKNKNYSGDSNISYFLENRYHLSLPIPVYLAKGGGKVIVDIVVDRQGRVVSATPRSSSGIKDQLIYDYARIAASRTLFNPDPAAPPQQKGTIHYNFVAQ